MDMLPPPPPLPLRDDQLAVRAGGKRAGRVRRLCQSPCDCCVNFFWKTDSRTYQELADAAAQFDGSRTSPYIDSHCHLEVVLNYLSRRETVPSVCKGWNDMTKDERCCWQSLGWDREQWDWADSPNPLWSKSWAELTEAETAAANAMGLSADAWDAKEWSFPHVKWKDLCEEMCDHLVILGESANSWDNALGDLEQPPESSYIPRNPVWGCRWEQLTETQQEAVVALGWDASAWDNQDWRLPDVSWLDLHKDMRHQLEVLGENASTWQRKLRWSHSHQAETDCNNIADEDSYRGWVVSIFNTKWSDLTQHKREAAATLGWSDRTWDGFASESMAGSTTSDDCDTTQHAESNSNADLVSRVFQHMASVSSGKKTWDDLTKEERSGWQSFGWNRRQWEMGKSANPLWSKPWDDLTPSEIDAASALGWDKDEWEKGTWHLPYMEWCDLCEEVRRPLMALGESGYSWPYIWDKAERLSNTPSKKVWRCYWEQMTRAQQKAVVVLGWDAASWDKSEWMLPSVEWKQLSEARRIQLGILGENACSWKRFVQERPAEQTNTNRNGIQDFEKGCRRNPERLGESAESSERMFPVHATRNGSRKGKRNKNKKQSRLGAGSDGDWRGWDDLNSEEQAAACQLGFTASLWDNTDVPDVDRYINNFCGTGFEGCITQGCDPDSIEDAIFLATSHKKVFASFGCHPKSAWLYDDDLEKRILSCFDTCGKKARAWGEFGLDYSSTEWGWKPHYRKRQQQVFARQLRLALAREKPLVLHLRDAPEDSLQMLRELVPRGWKAHIHSFLGSQEWLETVLKEFPNFFFGIAGTATLGGHAQNVATAVPLDRLLLETDAPYLSPVGTDFNHLGQIPLIARKVADLKRVDPQRVMSIARKNAHWIYGI